MSDNLIVSYPRCGQQWLELRLAMMFHLHPECGVICFKREDLRDAIAFSHCGFHDVGYNSSYFQVGKLFSSAKRFFILIRDPKAVMTSSFHFVWGMQTKYTPGIIEKRGVPADLSSYVTSNYGAIKYANFLNGVQDKIVFPGRGGSFICYEDMFDIKFLINLPHIAGFDIQLTKEDIELIYKASLASEILKFTAGLSSAIDLLPPGEKGSLPFIKHLCTALVGNSDPEKRMLRKAEKESYKKDLRKEEQEAVDHILKSNCRLNYFNKRYLQKVGRTKYNEPRWLKR